MEGLKAVIVFLFCLERKKRFCYAKMFKMIVSVFWQCIGYKGATPDTNDNELPQRLRDLSGEIYPAPFPYNNYAGDNIYDENGNCLVSDCDSPPFEQYKKYSYDVEDPFMGAHVCCDNTGTYKPEGTECYSIAYYTTYPFNYDRNMDNTLDSDVHTNLYPPGDRAVVTFGASFILQKSWGYAKKEQNTRKEVSPR